MNKVLANLKAWEAGEKHRAVLTAHHQAVEASRLNGPTMTQRRDSGFMEGIYAHLQLLNPECTIKPLRFEEGTIAIVDDEPRTEWFGWQPAKIEMPHRVWIDVSEQYTEISRWRSRPNGKCTIKVGDYGDYKSFRQLKDGTFKYREIALEISHRLTGMKAAAQREAARRANLSAVEAVANRAGFQPYRGITLTSSDFAEQPVYVKIEKTLRLSQDDALKLLTALKEFGIG